MNFENGLEQNPIHDPYDDNHDSDLEARLYAEIHFSNNIIGEETNSTTNNQAPDVLSSGSKKLDNNKSPDELIKQLNQTQNSGTNDTSKSTIKTSTSMCTGIENTKKKIDTPQKRSSANNTNELNNSNKKKKQESGFNTQAKEHIPPAETNKIINPYHQAKINDKNMIGLPLLSAEFINLLFKRPAKIVKKSTKKQKLNKKKKSKNKSNKLPNKDVPQQINSSKSAIQNQPINKTSAVDKEIYQSNLEESLTVIDISSEDSLEDDSKYNRIVATDKKFCKKKTVLTESEESTSDSEESIFEVPIPPKPAPPVIELKDSGSEVDNDNESDNESSSDNSSKLQKHMKQSKGDKSVKLSVTSSNNECNAVLPVNEPDNIVLNCTEIQKGVSSLSEIKEMRKLSNQSPLKTKDSMQIPDVQQNCSHSINMCRTENLSNQQNQIHSSKSKDKVASTLNKKQSNSQLNSKMLSNEEYFFQPMNNKMKAFYNESWGGENFNMDELKSKMSSDPNKWTILHTDIVASFAKRKRYFGMVCSRCHKEGHRQNQCTEIIKLPTCHMCGETGHIEVNCPKTMCLTCGQKQNMYRKTCENCRRLCCSRCQSRGHLSYACPDLWRRFHQTIDKTNAEPPSNLQLVIKSRNELQCCNCARKGHVSTVCNKLRWSQHFPNPEHVTNYSGPPYYQDYELSRNLNDTVESSLNINSSFDSSLNVCSTIDNSLNLNSTHEESSKNDNLVTRPTNTSRGFRNTLTFHVKQQLTDESVSMKNTTISIKLQSRNPSIDYGNWTHLEKFLNSVATTIPSEFSMEQTGTQVKIRMKCQRKIAKQIEKFIKQYANRNSNERSHMLTSCERSIHTLTNNLTENLNKLNNLNEDPLKLYEESKQLNRELMNKENRALDSLDYSIKVSRLSICLRNLLMILYREGFLDNSLKKLRLIQKKFMSDKKYVNKPRSLIPLRDLLPYLHYFNNVFSPHEHPQLKVAMQKFQEHSERINRLKNNPLLFPQIHNELVNKELNQNAVINNDSPALVAPSTSNIPPLLPSSISKAGSSQSIPDRFQNCHSLAEEVQHNKNADNLQYLKRHPRGLFLESVKSTKKGSKTKLTKKLKNFQKETKKLISTAKELNVPHLHKHIDILQKKMQNDIYVYEKDVKLLRQHVNEELKRRKEKQR